MSTSQPSRCGMVAEQGATLLLAPQPTDAERTPPSPASPRLPAFRPRREIYILHHHFGRVVEIGLGGIRFTYLGRAGAAEPGPAPGTLFTAGEAIDGLGLEVVAEGVLASAQGGQLLMERWVGFGELTDEQLERLERFILDHAHIPRWS